jgi:hypothetical protein
MRGAFNDAYGRKFLATENHEAVSAVAKRYYEENIKDGGKGLFVAGGPGS